MESIVEVFKIAIYTGVMLYHDQTISGKEIYLLIILLLSIIVASNTTDDL